MVDECMRGPSAALLHSPLSSPHLCAHSIKPLPADERASTVLRMSRPRHFSVSISSNNSPLFQQKIPNGRNGREGKGWTDGRTRTPRRGGSIWRHWGKAARHSCSIHAMKAETYPLPRPCILQNSIFDHTRFRIRNYKNHQMR